MKCPVAFDTETALITDEVPFPSLTCSSWTIAGDGLPNAALLDHIETKTAIAAELDLAIKGERVIVGHNVAFDFGVIACEYPELLIKICEAYEADGITDTMLRQQLIDIAHGCYEGFASVNGKRQRISYSLDFTSQRLLNIKLQGKGDIQLGYGKLRGVPISSWTPEQRDYPKGDAIVTLGCYLAQEKHGDLLEDQYRQARAAFWLSIMSARGLRTDREYVHHYLKSKVRSWQELGAKLKAAGLISAKGSRNTKAVKARIEATWDRSKGPIPSTPKGDIATGKSVIKQCTDPLLKKYMTFSSNLRSISTNGPILVAGIDKPIHTRFIVLRETGRTSSRKPNIQNPDREEGFRECFIPSDPTYAFIQADWHLFECMNLAQICYSLFGFSAMREALNAGRDIHLEIASQLLHEPYASLEARINDTDVNMARQTGKVANFGFPGGLGAKSLVDFALQGYNVEITEDAARQLKAYWLHAWPEMQHYFTWVNSQVGSSNRGRICHLFSNRWRGGATYTAACNSFFQGLASDGAKTAGWAIMRECYTVPSSPLYGFYPVLFIHDEFILEGPEDRAPEAAERLSELMVLAAQRWLPDMKIVAHPCVMDRWSKKAKTLRDENGRLRAYRYARKVG